MFQVLPPSLRSTPNRKRIHQHHESKKWVRLPANERCLECFPPRKPFLETAFGRLPPEIRADIFKDVLAVGSISPLKDGISVPMTWTKQDTSECRSEIKPSIGPVRPASCLALLQTCRQIYRESSLLFYNLNTLYLSDSQAMISFLRHLGPAHCDELRSLHLEDILEPTPLFSREYLDRLRSQGSYSEATLASFAASREDMIPSDAKKALELLNKRGNMWKIYLDMRPSQTLEYIKLCTLIPGFKNRQIVFESPTRWSVKIPSKQWEKRGWFKHFIDDMLTAPMQDKPYRAYWGGDAKYRVKVDILRALPEGRNACMDYHRSVDGGTGEGSNVNTAMEGLSLS